MMTNQEWIERAARLIKSTIDTVDDYTNDAAAEHVAILPSNIRYDLGDLLDQLKTLED